MILFKHKITLWILLIFISTPGYHVVKRNIYKEFHKFSGFTNVHVAYSQNEITLWENNELCDCIFILNIKWLWYTSEPFPIKIVTKNDIIMKSDITMKGYMYINILKQLSYKRKVNIWKKLCSLYLNFCHFYSIWTIHAI